ncbi:toprim domain-containing protein, partial [Candidatus Kaiserbacteria bacterium]|nr:toprim domain-containing protein [Candidatus Kaiserbacteria bacterium]
LEKRGVKKDAITKWRIGFAPGPPKYGWRETKEELEKKGFKQDELLKAGLIKTTEGGKEPFDVFRDRVMFPMAEPSGKIVAFSGRILHPDDKAPKYVNSPETLLYKKSELLYGYDKAKTGIRSLDFSLIVEGQFDVVMCHQAGYNNAVAVSGTALTLHHVQLLERMSDKVVLALDADRAGINAMKKGAELMLGRGLDVKVAELPMGKDPADIIQESVSDFKKCIGKSVHVIEFLLHVLKREAKDERSFKLKVREEVLPFILLLPNRIDQEHFVKKVAEYIDSTTEAIRFELNHLREKQEKEALKELRYGDSYDENVAKSKGEFGTDDGSKAQLFLKASSMVIEDSLKKSLEKELTEVLKIANLDEPAESVLAGTVFSLEQQFTKIPKLAIKEEIVNKLNRLKTTLIRGRLAELKQELIRLEQENDDEQFTQTLKKITEYEAKLREPAYTVETMFVET